MKKTDLEEIKRLRSGALSYRTHSFLNDFDVSGELLPISFYVFKAACPILLLCEINFILILIAY